jgi:hypothetical protein
MSNKSRISRAAEEAEATRREKETRKKETAKAPGAAEKAEKPKKPSGRMKIVWALVDPSWKSTKRFPYPEKAKAEAEAKRLTKEKGAPWTIRPEKVPMDE